MRPSRVWHLGIGLAAALALTACNREDRPTKSVVETGP